MLLCIITHNVMCSDKDSINFDLLMLHVPFPLPYLYCTVPHICTAYSFVDCDVDDDIVKSLKCVCSKLESLT